MAEVIKTPTGVLSYPNLFKARSAVPGQDPRFSINLIFDKAAQKDPLFRAMRQEVHKAIVEKWGEAKARDERFIKGLHLPFRDVSEKEDVEGYDVEGGVFVAAWSKHQPGVVDGRLQPMVEGDGWAGQLARATVRPFAWENAGKRGVSLGLNNVQIVRADMPSLGGGRRKPEQDFDVVEDSGGGGADLDDVPF